MEASHRNSIRNTSAARRQSFECFSPPQAKLCTLQSDVGGAQYGAARRRRSSTRLSPPQAESSARPQPAAGGALHASARRRRRAPHAHSPPQAELCTPQPAAGGGSSACTQPVATGGLSTPLSPALSAQEPAAGGAPSAVRPAAGGALRARTRRRRRSARSPARHRRRSRVPARHSSPQRAASPLARRIYSPAAGEDRFAPRGDVEDDAVDWRADDREYLRRLLAANAREKQFEASTGRLDERRLHLLLGLVELFGSPREERHELFVALVRPFRRLRPSSARIEHAAPNFFLHAESSKAALKVFRRWNACAELRGAILRDDDDEKRSTVSG